MVNYKANNDGVHVKHIYRRNAKTGQDKLMLFPDIDWILDLEYTDAKTFLGSVQEEAWLTNLSYTGENEEVLTQQFTKIEQQK